MERTEHRFSLDVQKTVAGTVIAMKKGETAHRLLITLSEEGMPYHIGEDCTAVFFGSEAGRKAAVSGVYHR